MNRISDSKDKRLCATCMWRCGMMSAEVDERIGQSNVVGAARRKWPDLVPIRHNGGWHGIDRRHDGPTSCAKIGKSSGVKHWNPWIFDERTMKVIEEVDHAVKTMVRPPMGLLYHEESKKYWRLTQQINEVLGKKKFLL